MQLFKRLEETKKTIVHNDNVCSEKTNNSLVGKTAKREKIGGSLLMITSLLVLLFSVPLRVSGQFLMFSSTALFIMVITSYVMFFIGAALLMGVLLKKTDAQLICLQSSENFFP